MQRITALWNVSPLKLVGALFALTLAVAMAVGSGASFNAKTANANNTLTAGNLTHSNSGNGAIMTAGTLKPGDTTTGTVDITNTGDINGVFTLAKSNLSDTPASPAFSSKLDLKVEDLGNPATSPAPTPVVKYNGKLGAMPSTALGTFTPNEKHRYRFTLTFPDGGSNGADNAYKGASHLRAVRLGVGQLLAPRPAARRPRQGPWPRHPPHAPGPPADLRDRRRGRAAGAPARRPRARGDVPAHAGRIRALRPRGRLDGAHRSTAARSSSTRSSPSPSCAAATSSPSSRPADAAR